jgi:hypothetical protein
MAKTRTCKESSALEDVFCAAASAMANLGLFGSARLSDSIAVLPFSKWSSGVTIGIG